jgi:hypothetical protein
MSEALVEEIESISEQAFDLATTVAQHPALRRQMAEAVELLRSQLREVVDSLKRTDPAVYQLVSDKVSEALLDLNYAEAEVEDVSRRLALFMELERLRASLPPEKYDKSFPLPEDAQNITKTLRTDAVNFQTRLSLGGIAEFYRRAFAEQGFPERRLFAYPSNEYVSLIFEGLPNNRIIVVMAIDLAYSSEQDLRNVNIHTEEDTWKDPDQRK